MQTTPPESLPESSRSFYRLYAAEALWGLGRREEALARYTELTSAEDAVAAAAYRRLFLGVQPEGDLQQLQILMQKAEERFAGNASVLADLWVQIGIESVRQGMLQLGEYFLGRAWGQPEKRSLPDTVPLYLAEIRLRQGKLAEAAALLEEYLALNPPRADRVLLRLGEVRLRQESFPAAADLFERYLAAYAAGGGGSRRRPTGWPMPASGWGSWTPPASWLPACSLPRPPQPWPRTCIACRWPCTANAGRPGRRPRCSPSMCRSIPRT